MSSRSIVVRLMLGFACAGALAGCNDSSKNTTPGKDASPDSRPSDKDATVVADTNLTAGADGSQSRDGGEPGKKDAVVEDTSAVRADAEPKDGGADATEKLDAPPAVDAPADSVYAVDGKAVDARPTSDTNKPADAATGADSKPGIDSNLPASCQGILLDNTFMPPTYPVLYREPASAAEIFATRTAALRSAYGLDDADYTFEPMPISWTAGVEQGTGPCTLALGGPLSKETALTTVQAFLSRWGDLFQYQDNGKESMTPSCDSKFCMVRLAQDYCGLPVYSKEQSYRGDAYVDVYASNGCLWRAVSHFVPMIPIPSNVLLSEEKLKQAMIGLTLKYACSSGERTVQVSQDDSFTMPVGPSVLVRTSPTEASTLEYRLAVPIVVEIGGSNGMPWVIYVDGIDGTVLATLAGFNCD